MTKKNHNGKHGVIAPDQTKAPSKKPRQARVQATAQSHVRRDVGPRIANALREQRLEKDRQPEPTYIEPKPIPLMLASFMRPQHACSPRRRKNARNRWAAHVLATLFPGTGKTTFHAIVGKVG